MQDEEWVPTKEKIKEYLNDSSWYNEFWFSEHVEIYAFS